MQPASTSIRSLRFVRALILLGCALGVASAQRHDLGSSPPTAPPPKPVVVPQVIVPDPIFAGLGP
ncbi:MAG TPA: hypothetical protein VIJ38_03565, partial [Acidobacteriaceae bacterium]